MRSWLIALALMATPALGACPPLDKAGLDKLASGRKAPLDVIFFASWCSSCKDHLAAKHGENTVLIGVFDKKERIEATVASLGVKTACYFDEGGITDALKIKSLPMQIRYPSAAP